MDIKCLYFVLLFVYILLTSVGESGLILGGVMNSLQVLTNQEGEHVER